MIKIKYIVILIIFSLFQSISFAKSQYPSYEALINSYPNFLINNYFEDNDSYYYMLIKDITDKAESRRWRKNKKQSLKNEFMKIRGNALSTLTESICCGFDVVEKLSNFRENINSVASSLDLKKWSASFSSGQTGMKISNVEVLLKKEYKNILVYAIKIDKNNITNFDTDCECTFAINTK